jgi:hypothetical protein
VNAEITKLQSEMAACVTDENRAKCNLDMLFGEPKAAAASAE